jgi:hypothetical protein
MTRGLQSRLMLVLWLATSGALAAAADPLPSWNARAAKQGILDFVRV